jgi:hypothetical protein
MVFVLLFKVNVSIKMLRDPDHQIIVFVMASMLRGCLQYIVCMEKSSWKICCPSIRKIQFNR